MNWKEKLGSRKFWAFVVTFVGSILAMFLVDAETAERVIAMVTAFGSMAVYVFAEAYVDAHRTIIIVSEEEGE